MRRSQALIFSLILILGCSDPDLRSTGQGSPTLPSYALPAGWGEADLERAIRDAQVKMQSGDNQAVVDGLRNWVSQPEADPRVSFLYGKALLQLGNASLALWPLARVAETTPPESDADFLFARSLVMGGDPIAAVRLLDELVEAVPDSTRLIELRTRAHRRNLDLESALADLDTLIEMRPTDVNAVEARIGLLVELDRIDDARDAVGELETRVAQLELPPAGRAHYCASAALFEHQNGNDALARERFGTCLEKYPGLPEVVLPWTVFLEGVGDSEAAIVALEEAVAGAGSGRLRLHVALARRYAETDRHAEAEALLRSASEDFDEAQTLFLLADHMIDWRELGRARDVAYEAIEKQFGSRPGDADFDWSSLPAEGRFAFGDLLIRAGQSDAEIPRLIESFEVESAGNEAVYPILLKARYHLEKVEPEQALALFEESFRYWPSNVGARYLAGRSSMEMGAFDQGLSFYRDAFRAEPTGSDAGLVLARMYAAEGLALPAADTLSTLLGQSSEEPEALRLFGQVTSILGALDSAEATRKDLMRFRDYHGYVHVDAAVALATREGIPSAIAYLEENANFEDPGQFEALSQWVSFRSTQGGLEEAKARVEALKAKAEHPAPYALVLARADAAAGESASAIAQFRAATELDESFGGAWSELGKALLKAGELAPARAAFERALAVDSDLVDAEIGLADVALADGEFEEARTRYRKFLVAHPWLARAAVALARIDLDQDEVGEQTLIWARWAARFYGAGRDEATRLLGEVRLARGEYAEAASILQVAAQRRTTPEPQLLHLLARALAQAGEERQALSALEEAFSVGEFESESQAEEAKALLAALKEGARS